MRRGTKLSKLKSTATASRVIVEPLPIWLMSLRLKSSVAMPFPPFSAGDSKRKNTVSSSLAGVVEDRMCDRSGVSLKASLDLS